MTIIIEPIGHIETARTQAEDDYWGGELACVVLDKRFSPDALKGLNSFSHVEIIFQFHLVEQSKIVSGARHPRNNSAWPIIGIFAQREKNRPNRIGSTICRVVKLEGRRLTVAELDAIDGTPVLDIKPIMKEFLPRETVYQPEWAKEIMKEYWEMARK